MITYIGEPDYSTCYKGCYWSRLVSVSFRDLNNVIIKDSQELFTPTLISGIFTTGNTIKILYKPRQEDGSLLETLVPNLGPPV